MPSVWELVCPPLNIKPSLMADNESPRPNFGADIDTVAWFIKRSLAVSTGALLHVVTTWELSWPVVPVLTVVSVMMIAAWAAVRAREIAARAGRKRWIVL